MSGSSTAPSSGGTGNDVAALAFAVDSSPLVAATTNLDSFKASADALAVSQDNLTQRTQKFLAVAQDMSDSTASLRRQFQDASQSLEGMIQSLDNARGHIDSTTASLNALGAAQGQVAALGQSFGVTSAGVEAFNTQAQALGLSAGQTTLALQRITEALQNQTLAGQQVREQIRGLGVDLAGLTSNDANQVLAQVVTQLRGAQDGIGKYQTESGILGVTDPSTLYGLNTPGYITTAQRRDLGYATQAGHQIAQTTQFISQSQQNQNIDSAAYDDLNSQYNLDRGFFSRQSNVFSGLSAAQASQLAGAVGLPSDSTFSSQDDRLTALRYLAANPNSDLANAARRPLTSLSNNLQTGYLGDEYRHLTDGTFSLDNAAINQQFTQDENASSNPLQQIGAAGTYIGRLGANVLGLYTPPAPSPDARQQDADTQIRQNNVAGAALEGFGDSSLSSYQAIGGSLRKLQDPASLAYYQNLYGAQEGQARYYGTLSGMQRDQQTALTTGGAQINAANQEGYMLGQPLAQRPEMTALLQFMGTLGDQKGNIPALWSGSSPMSMSDILNSSGTSGGPGVLTPEESTAFQKFYGQQQKNAQTANDQQFGLNLTDAQAVTVASGQSPQQVMQVTTAIQAYNDAITKGLDPVKAVAQAEQLLTEKRNAAGEAIMAQQRLADQQAQTALRVTGAAGSDPVARAAASLGLGIENDYTALGNTANVSQAQYQAIRRSQYGTQALQFGQDQVAGAELNLQNAGSAIGPNAESAQRTQQVMSSFSDALAKAATAGGTATESLNRMIDSVLQLDTAAARFQFEDKNFDAARTAGYNASYTSMVAGAAPDQRQQLQALQPIVSQPGFNPVLNARAPLSASTMEMIQSQGAAMGLDPGLIQQAMQVAQMEGAGNGGLLASNPQAAFGLTSGTLSQFNLPTPSNASGGVSDMLQILQNYSKNFPNNPMATGLAYNTGPNSPGLQKLIASNYTDFSGLNAIQSQYANGMGIYTPQQAVADAQGDPALAAQIGAAGQTRQAQTGLQIANSQSQFTATNSADAQILALLRAGLTGAATLVQAGVNTNPLNPQLGAVQASQNVANAQFNLQRQGASNAASTDQDISNNQQLGAAYATSAEAVLKLNAALQAQKEVQAGTITQAQEGTRAAQLYADAVSQQAVAFGKLTQANNQSISQSQFQSNLPIQDAATRQQQVQQNAAFQQIDQQYTDPNLNAQAKAQYQAVQANQQLAQSAATVNDAFNQMGQSIFNTMEQAINSGQRFRQTLGQLATGIADIIAKLLIEKPLEAAISNGFGSILGTSVNGVATPGAGGGLFGYLFGGADTTTAIGGTAFTQLPASIPGLTLDAAGGVFTPQGRQRMFAAGGVFSGPTPFSDTSGNSNVAGEAGPEAILPLKTLADGSLGVATGGAGGGPITIIGHAPVTWNGGGGGAGGQADPGAIKALQAQIERATESAVKAVILRQQRPGGFLYGTIPQ